jgi:hypothetical protein
MIISPNLIPDLSSGDVYMNLVYMYTFFLHFHGIWEIFLRLQIIDRAVNSTEN